MAIQQFFLLMVLSISLMQPLYAEETDQFTIPPYAIEDSGPSASRSLYQLLERIRTKTNEEMRIYKARSLVSPHAAKQLALRSTDAYLVNAFYKNTGPGFPRWLQNGAIPKNSRYEVLRPWNNLYWLVFSHSPLVLLKLAPTINMFNYYFGMDKLGHFFMQGHSYYTLYTFLKRHGRSSQQAHVNLIMYGRMLEFTYLGIVANGIFSNGDLSANYSGWKFYMNFAHRIQIGSDHLAPLFVLKNGQWEYGRAINPDELLKPYLTDNLSEAFNPSFYTFSRGRIRHQVMKRCGEWISRRGLTKQMADEKFAQTKLWHGEDYGHWLPTSQQVTLATCFGGR